MSFDHLRFDDVLPYLASAYRSSRLVPFIGSGMSVGACTGWQKFVEALVATSGVPHSKPPGAGDMDSAAMYRLADKAVLGLSAMPLAKRIEAYRAALNVDAKSPGQCAIPAQTEALAQCYWPLVLSTNYDDLYIASRMRQSDPAEMTTTARLGSSAHGKENEIAETDIPEVLGRSVEDCHKVIRSLDSPSRPILWALQGFLGGQAEKLSALYRSRVLDKPRHLELAGQVVVGHQQYQHATNAQPHFRRSFAEVFSRRSLLFVGSGILEEYLVNLFGEIAHHYGPGPHPHFALFCRQSFGARKEPPDPRFFQTRLGITPVVYDTYAELPDLLNRLAEAVGKRPSRSAPGTASPVSWMPDELGFSLVDGLNKPSPTGGVKRGGPAVAPRKLRLRYASLPVPTAKDECVIVSTGRSARHKRPIHGRQAKDLLTRARGAGLLKTTAAGQWEAFRGGSTPPLAFRFGDAPIFAVAARVDPPTSRPHPDDPEDSRDLGIIMSAVSESLRMAEQAGFTRVHIGPVASGQYRLWTPLHPFIQTLAGVRHFFAQHPNSRIQQVELYVFSPGVWFPVVAGKIPVGEILSSNVMKVWVDVRNAEGASELFAVTLGGTSAPVTVRTLKELCGLPVDRMDAEILPRSGKSDPSHDDDRVVTPASIVVFSPRA
ncbi:SIR2 family protein [Myxococcus landrumensis]|uniref:SIR2 family protein n=1 Tax=Myxococcus landrumensis TaxID=2813577 RepID=A0ABX7N6R4_9BACT|nr:SIR2 family protein [Myxococcus landrumus]QSQ14143.1 SIR2 family protein [Myxococcus landrumus]